MAEPTPRFDEALDVVGAEASTVSRISALMRAPGAAVWRDAFDFAALSSFAAAVESSYARLQVLTEEHGVFGVTDSLPPGVRYQPAAAALGLDSVDGWECVPELIVPLLGDVARDLVGPAPMLDIDICWLRRQHPSALRSEGQAPHTFHQDGAYGFDFLATPEGGDSLLPMLTAWIPLCPAGVDAPGLELVEDSPHRVLGLAELAAPFIDEHWPPSARIRPALLPGDIVLMAGHHLHRTHVTEEMTRSRTSIELRFVPGDRSSHRLAGHRLLPPP